MLCLTLAKMRAQEDSIVDMHCACTRISVQLAVQQSTFTRLQILYVLQRTRANVVESSTTTTLR